MCFRFDSDRRNFAFSVYVFLFSFYLFYVSQHFSLVRYTFIWGTWSPNPGNCYDSRPYALSWNHTVFGENKSDGTTVGNSLNNVIELHLASDFHIFQNRFCSLHTHQLMKYSESSYFNKFKTALRCITQFLNFSLFCIIFFDSRLLLRSTLFRSSLGPFRVRSPQSCHVPSYRSSNMSNPFYSAAFHVSNQY